MWVAPSTWAPNGSAMNRPRSGRSSQRIRVPVVNGPETRRNPPIRRFVVVLKRPDAVARRVQDFAVEDAEAALEEEVQLIGSDPANVGFVEAPRERALGRRTAPHRGDAAERGGHVRRPERRRSVRCDIRTEQEAPGMRAVE